MWLEGGELMVWLGLRQEGWCKKRVNGDWLRKGQGVWIEGPRDIYMQSRYNERIKRFVIVIMLKMHFSCHT